MYEQAFCLLIFSCALSDILNSYAFAGICGVGNGWYIRHIRSISDFAQQNPKKVKAGVHKYLVDKLPDFEAK